MTGLVRICSITDQMEGVLVEPAVRLAAEARRDAQSAPRSESAASLPAGEFAADGQRDSH